MYFNATSVEKPPPVRPNRHSSALFNRRASPHRRYPYSQKTTLSSPLNVHMVARPTGVAASCR
ncbi:hypothetical protein KCP74_15015 [Salmonella enterica subsp. enterica]|nr:hypothetical protein KCP74_15015 [Salmonella enterica subsp. enterica]